MPDAPQARFCYTALPFPSFLLGFAPNESSIGKHGPLVERCRGTCEILRPKCFPDRLGSSDEPMAKKPPGRPSSSDVHADS